MNAAAGATKRKPINIVLLSDGTGNAGAKAQGTNVWTLYEHLDRSPPASETDRRQLAFYDDGVGTQKFLPLKIVGGAFGYGLFRNVKQLYTSLVEVYEPGDSIYLFGFSRGAHTIRTLCGLITRFGILKPQQNAAATASDVDALCHAQRMDFARARAGAPPAAPAGLVFHAAGGSEVAFLGVWDTVDAVGLPFNAQVHLLNPFFHWRLPERSLSAKVRCARHALSLDDRRRTFWPTLFQRPVNPNPEVCADLEQVWFAGVHTNVGGGYDKDQLAYEALTWMLAAAAAKGLRVEPTWHRMVPPMADPLGLKYESRGGMWAFYRFAPRPVRWLCKRRNQSVCVHQSVLDRIRDNPSGYAPHNLPAVFQEVPRDPASPPAMRARSAGWPTVSWTPLSGDEERLRGAVTARTRLYWGFITWLLAPAAVTLGLRSQAALEGGKLWSAALAIGLGGWVIFALAYLSAPGPRSNPPRRVLRLVAAAGLTSMLLGSLALLAWGSGGVAREIAAGVAWLEVRDPLNPGAPWDPWRTAGVAVLGLVAMFGVPRWSDKRSLPLSVGSYLLGGILLTLAAIVTLPHLVGWAASNLPDLVERLAWCTGPICDQPTPVKAALLTLAFALGCTLPALLSKAVPALAAPKGLPAALVRALPAVAVVTVSALGLLSLLLEQVPTGLSLPSWCAAWTLFVVFGLFLLLSKKVLQSRYDAAAHELLGPLRPLL